MYFSSKTTKTWANQLKWTISEFWQLTEAKEWTESHLSKGKLLNFGKTVRSVNFNLWLLPFSLFPQRHSKSWQDCRQWRVMTDYFWRPIKSTIPRTLLIFCQNLQLPGKTIFRELLAFLFDSVLSSVVGKKKPIPGLPWNNSNCWQHLHHLRLWFQLGHTGAWLGT